MPQLTAVDSEQKYDEVRNEWQGVVDGRAQSSGSQPESRRRSNYKLECHATEAATNTTKAQQKKKKIQTKTIAAAAAKAKRDYDMKLIIKVVERQQREKINGNASVGAVKDCTLVESR